MKIIKFILTCSVLYLSIACETNILTKYKDNPAIYFLKDTRSWLKTYQADSISYSFFAKEDDRMRDTIWVTVCTMGFPSNHDRTFNVVQATEGGISDPVSDSQYVSFDNPEITKHLKVKAGEVTAAIPVIIKKEALDNKKEYRLNMRIVNNDNFIPGINDQVDFLIKFTSMAIKPILWDKNWINTFGTWGPEKMKFIIKYVGISDFGVTSELDIETLNYYNIFANEQLKKHYPNNSLVEADKTIVEFP